MAEINSALAVGKEVITHTSAISVPGWSGAGYIILDPVTGDGSYKIGGGANGGFKELKDKALFWAGSLKYVWDKLPKPVQKLITGTLGLIISKVIGLIDLLSKCKSIAAAITISLAFFAWNAIFLALMAAVVAMGPIGVVIGYALTAAEYLLEGIVKEELASQC